MIIDFLTLEHEPEDLAAALKIIRAFKQCESEDEWVLTPSLCWLKQEQLEEFLAHLVEGAPLQADTVRQLQGESPRVMSPARFVRLMERPLDTRIHDLLAAHAEGLHETARDGCPECQR